MANESQEEWCWSDGEEAHGPYDTRDAAIALATQNCDPGDAIRVGHVVRMDPREFTWAMGLDDVMESMHNSAGDNGWSFADPDLFEVDDEKAAGDELKEFFMAWITKHITSGYWRQADDAESVTLPGVSLASDATNGVPPGQP